MILLKTLFFWLIVGAAFFGVRRRRNGRGFESGSALYPRDDRRN